MEYDFDQRPLVYVAGPYASPDPVENTHNAIQVADRLNASGVVTAVKSVVPGKNADVIEQAARLWLKDTDRVLDMTFGKGAFWKKYRPYHLVEGDLNPTKGDGFDFRARPEPDETFDVVVLDPPYVSQGGRKTSTIPDFTDAYGLDDAPGTADEIDELVYDGMQEAKRLLVPNGFLFVKTMDYITSGKFHQGHQRVVDSAWGMGLEQVDEFVHVSGTGPQPTKNLDGSPRRQVHSRRAHSFLCIFQKPKLRGG